MKISWYVVHSQLLNYNILTFDPCRYTPGHLIPNKWESCFTIQHSSWGYDRTEGIEDFWNTSRLLWQLVSSVSCNGNLLLNVGPTADGRIVPAFQERLLEMGAWLEVCVCVCMHECRSILLASFVPMPSLATVFFYCLVSNPIFAYCKQSNTGARELKHGNETSCKWRVEPSCIVTLWIV